MATIDSLVQDFLAQKRIAVTGVTRQREDAANLNYRKFKLAGYTVYAVNPNTKEFDGDRCYPDLASLPEKVDGVLIVNRGEVTEQIVRQCIEMGIPRVWIHCALGSRPPGFLRKAASSIGSPSPEVLRLCRENNIAVIAGACPMMFLQPDAGHGMMRTVLGALGALRE